MCPFCHIGCSVVARAHGPSLAGAGARRRQERCDRRRCQRQPKSGSGTFQRRFPLTWARRVAGDVQGPSGTGFDPGPQFWVDRAESTPWSLAVVGRCFFGSIRTGQPRPSQACSASGTAGWSLARMCAGAPGLVRRMMWAWNLPRDQMPWPWPWPGARLAMRPAGWCPVGCCSSGSGRRTGWPWSPRRRAAARRC
jgi:hypothetical protein